MKITKQEHQMAQAIEWCKNAQNWIRRSKTYGPDMKSSADSCIVDAEVCIIYALGYLKDQIADTEASKMIEFAEKQRASK